MSELTIAGGLIGGLGLLVLGLRIAADGLTSAARGAFRDLEPWTGDRRRALGSGVLFAALLPGSSAPVRTAVSLSQRGRMLLFDGMWVGFGCALGAALAAWWSVLAYQVAGVGHVALALTGVGVAWSAWRSNQGWARYLTGFGLLLFALPTLGAAMSTLLEVSAYPGLDISISTRLALGATAGAAVSAIVRGPSVVALLSVLAASAGLLTVPSALAWIIGAHLGSAFAVRHPLMYGTPDARRVASSYLVFHVLAAAVGTAAFYTGGPWFETWSSSVGGVGAMVALCETGACLVALGFLRPLDNALARFLGGRFADAVEAAPGERDEFVLPELALDGLREDVVGISETSRELARTFLSGQPLTDFRLGKDLESVEERATRVDVFLKRLLGAGSHPEVAALVVPWTGAMHAHRELIDLIVAMRRQPLNRAGDLSSPLRSRLQQLQWAVLHMIESADAFKRTEDSGDVLGELAGVEHQVRDLRSRFVVNFREGVLTPAQLDQLLERLDWLGASARAALRAAGLRRAERLPKLPAEGEREQIQRSEDPQPAPPSLATDTKRPRPRGGTRPGVTAPRVAAPPSEGR